MAFAVIPTSSGSADRRVLRLERQGFTTPHGHYDCEQVILLPFSDSDTRANIMLACTDRRVR